MSGNEFSGTVEINVINLYDTVEKLFNEYLEPIGIEEYRYIGSTGKSTFSGDIDLCISYSPNNKKSLTNILKEQLGEENAKVSGQNVTVKFPVAGTDNQHVQIDLMLSESENVSDTAWLMSGDSKQGVKGVYRNLMLCHIAKKVSNKMPENEKITISFPGGLQYKRLEGKKWVNIKQKITDPHKILNTLGISERPENTTTFRQLIDYMIENEKLFEYLDDFNVYIDNYIKRDPENANRALWYIKAKERLKNEREVA
jgi:hypothetical protein